MTRHATEDTEAYQMYLQGRYYWNKRTLEGVQQSIDFFQQAIQKDPKYALAYAGQADAYALLGDFNVLPAREVMPKVKAAASKALELDDTLGEAHTSLAFAKFHEWDWAGAEKEFKRAIELNAELSDGARLVWRVPDGARTLRRGAGGNESGRRTQSALAGDQPGARHSLLLRAPVSAGHRAVPEDAGDGRRLPGRARIPGPRAICRRHAYPEGIAEFRKALQLSDGDTNELAALGLRACVRPTRRPRRARFVDQLKERSQQTYVQPMWVAVIYLALGDKDQAFDWMQKAYRRPLRVAGLPQGGPAVRRHAPGCAVHRSDAPHRSELTP